ncbi:hypothetical protein PsorP6_001353 [Peronosclerospora sorghi]|uniref:Uncharacterized protein n=1 Tax=Peronosclerospora sorghi TaxID=230839 RepID=A0ACC0WUJ4_9STRA|nr:hypothetical protein PsorP6_001353 [Peronosclerospora sorghi]
MRLKSGDRHKVAIEGQKGNYDEGMDVDNLLGCMKSKDWSSKRILSDVRDVEGNKTFATAVRVIRRFIENEHKETLAEMFKNTNQMWKESGCNASSSMKSRGSLSGVRSVRNLLCAFFYLKNYLKREKSDAAKYGITQFEKNELWWVRNLKKHTAWATTVDERLNSLDLALTGLINVTKIVDLSLVIMIKVKLGFSKKLKKKQNRYRRYRLAST